MKHFFLSLFATFIIIISVYFCGLFSNYHHYKELENKLQSTHQDLSYDDIVESAYNEAYEFGRQEGYYSGSVAALEDYPDYNDGYADGESFGYDCGYCDGYENGYEDGYDENSYDDSYYIGYDDGYDEGYDNGLKARHTIFEYIGLFLSRGVVFFIFPFVISFFITCLPWFKD